MTKEDKIDCATVLVVGGVLLNPFLISCFIFKHANIYKEIGVTIAVYVPLMTFTLMMLSYLKYGNYTFDHKNPQPE